MRLNRTRTVVGIGTLAGALLIAPTASWASTDTTIPEQTSSMPAGPSGPLCAAVPTEGAGSVDSMMQSPVATAASENPLLSTLVTAVTAAGLGETLDSGGPFTVLAPVNSAFDKLDPATLEAALADPTGLLTTVLTYHVIDGQMSSSDLAAAGSVPTLQGEDVTLEVRNETLVINGSAAAVQCMDIPTANATVFLLDTVLLPPSMAAPPADAASEATMADTGTTTG